MKAKGKSIHEDQEPKPTLKSYPLSKKELGVLNYTLKKKGSGGEWSETKRKRQPMCGFRSLIFDVYSETEENIKVRQVQSSRDDVQNPLLNIQ